MFPIILPGSGRGVLPFAISPVVSTDNINCEPGIMIFNNVFSFLSLKKPFKMLVFLIEMLSIYRCDFALVMGL